MIDIASLKQATSIAAVLSAYGVNHRRNRCACPIHGGKNPTSFSFDDQRYHCFSCGAAGDVIALVMALAGVDFRGALKWLAGSQDTLAGEARPAHKLQAEVVIPTAVNSGLDLKREGIKSDLSFCRQLINVYSEALVDLRVRLRNGRIGLATFYAAQQKLDHRLDELDREEARLNWEFNNFRKETT